MNDQPVLALANDASVVGLGGKAAGLRWLLDNGFEVPQTWVVRPGSAGSARLREALRHVLDPSAVYAVRSSANVEDGGDMSYAGQFLSLLDVRGLDAVIEAIGRVCASAGDDGVAAYRDAIGDHRTVEMAVLVQRMVPPVASGVAFSKNPITGLNERVVEAVEGSGEALHAGGAIPQRWIQRWGDYVEQPSEPAVGPAVVDQLIRDVARIARLYGSPVDVEWVWDGSRVWWVQLRAISGIDDVAIYSRRIAKEVMPGIIKPLVWSVNVPMVNAAWIELFREAVGDLDLEPEDLARSFGYRAYFNMSTIGDIFAALGMPHESLELLLGLPPGSDQPRFKPSAATLGKTPRVVGMALAKLQYARVVEAALPKLEIEYARYGADHLSEVSDRALLDAIADLRKIGVQAASVNIVTPLLANVYTSLLRRSLRSSGIDLEAVDLTEGMDELAALDPNPALDALAGLLQDLDRDDATEQGYDGLPPTTQKAITQFLDRFGHFSDSGNDFSSTPWREQPELLVEMLAQRPISERKASRMAWSEVEARIPLWRKPIVRTLRHQARSFLHLRDAVSSLYTYGYGLFRPHYLELGERLAKRGELESASDVMLLTHGEAASALLGERSSDPLADVVRRRSAEIAAAADLEMPEVIYGDDFIPRPADDAAKRSWQGTPTARGHHRGQVRVVNGLGDFAKVTPGDVLAIPYSDVGWTPLFAAAGAVVAESGGMLSHSSIVAREYGIPCVVSVPGATRMPEGAIVTVDGYRGIVVLDEDPP